MDNNLNTLPEIAYIGNERHYMLLQNCKAKVFLLSDKEGKKPYIVKVSNIKVKLNFFMESWVVMITYLSTPNYCPTLSCWLRSIDGGIGSDEINRFMQRVKKDHPLHPIEYSFKEVPVIATSKTYCELPSSMFRHPIKLTLEEEWQLLQIIQSDECNKRDLLISWFRIYRAKYYIECRVKRDIGSEDIELMNMFCYIHGLLPYSLCTKQTISNVQRRQKSCFTLLCVAVGIVLSIYIGISIIDYAIKEIDDYFLWWTISIIGLLITFGPIGYFINLLKNQ